jgi:hypothetical protein
MHFLLRLPFPVSHTNFGIPKLLLVAEIFLAGYTIGSRLPVVLVPSSSDGFPLRENKSGRRRSSSSFRFCCLLLYVRRGSICGSRQQSWSCCSGLNVLICYSFSCNGALAGSSTIHWIIIDLQKVWPRGRRPNKLDVGVFFWSRIGILLELLKVRIIRKLWRKLIATDLNALSTACKQETVIDDDAIPQVTSSFNQRWQELLKTSSDLKPWRETWQVSCRSYYNGSQLSDFTQISNCCTEPQYKVFRVLIHKQKVSGGRWPPRCSIKKPSPQVVTLQHWRQELQLILYTSRG